MTMRDELIEAAAQAMFAHKWRRVKNPEMTTDVERFYWSAFATTALDAILAKLETPSEEMLGMGTCEVDYTNPYPQDVAGNVFRAMLQPLKAD